MTKLVFAFMRCNPPTKGHSYVIDKVRKLAHEMHCDHKIILSHSHDNKHNPLSPEDKLRYAEYFWPDVEFELASPEKPSMIQHLKELNREYNEVTVVCGDDRLQEYMSLFHKYNGRDFTYRKIKCVEAGDVQTRGSISSSAMRLWAKSGEFVPFFFGSPNQNSDDTVQTIKMYNDVRAGLGSR